ncbi:hypothetical protein HELRODRAFT_65965, partial [Helobdella robusta]|uniref:28S ribosomal protein S27, mitochondrial n=1 Tax=Helobdella robusta TaxID=6412 RepID=T1FYF3_HELRO
STCHALMRTLKEQGDYERLFKILEDKINYGIFLDDYTCNLLLDHFIHNNLYKEALRIVSDIMLQENFDHVITRSLSYYACHQYIKNLPDIKINAPPKVPDVSVCQKVPYIENPWYDDHFDLYSDILKLGKSLVMLAGSYADVVSRGYLVIGYLLYQKVDKALQVLKCYKEKHDGLMLLEYHAVKNCLVNKGLVQKEDIIDKTLDQIVRDSISSEENNLIQNQKNIYDTWNKERNRLIEDRERQLKIKLKKDEIAKKLIDLTQKEEKLRFYEEKTNMELKISEQPEFPKIKDVVLEEQFVAPPGERKSMEGGKKKSR